MAILGRGFDGSTGLPFYGFLDAETFESLYQSVDSLINESLVLIGRVMCYAYGWSTKPKVTRVERGGEQRLNYHFGELLAPTVAG